jgi:restriction system protein
VPFLCDFTKHNKFVADFEVSKMPVPDFQTLMRPVLGQILETPKNSRQLTENMIEEFSLTKEEQDELVPSGRKTRIIDRVQWVITYLVKAGCAERPSRGFAVATNRGRELFEQSPEGINIRTLQAFPEFLDFQTAHQRKASGNDEASPGSFSAPDQTPEDRIGAAIEEIDADLRDDLLARIHSASPEFFEQLIVDLMLAMGYGGPGRGERLGKSGDGGIDGIINEDVLGLDIVYLQAKRYAPTNTIPVSQIREFAGSLDERGALKGVFVTTSSFGQPAVQYAERSPKRLILIDGERLTSLMVHYGVGVRLVRTIKLQRVDEDYFLVDGS